VSPEEIAARILYRDEELIVLDKPAGLPVHPGPGGGITLYDFLVHLRFGLPGKPGLAHRLDKDTSGCLVLGRTKPVLARLMKQFSSRRVTKSYWAILCGIPEPGLTRIDLPLAPRQPGQGWQMRPDPDGTLGGQPAQTGLRVLAQAGDMALAGLNPLTGRTHQLRVHCAAMGFPILGDKIYGGIRPVAGGNKLQLHARSVSLPRHNQPPLVIEAPAPPHMVMAAERLGLALPEGESGP